MPLTQTNICLSARNVVDALALEGQDRLLNALPLFHAHGLSSGLMGALAAGSGVICTPGFDPAAFFGWLTEFRPTWYTAVPSFHRAILSEADRLKLGRVRSSLRLVRSASATLPAEVLNRLEALFGVPVIETYGMTEGSSQIASNPLDWRKLGSVGRATGPEIVILDEDDHFLAPGQQGEIALRGPTITRGYENDAAATATAFRGGWFRTGDLGYIDSRSVRVHRPQPFEGGDQAQRIASRSCRSRRCIAVSPRRGLMRSRSPFRTSASARTSRLRSSRVRMLR